MTTDTSYTTINPDQEEDTTRGDQVIAAFAGLLLVLCALTWLAIMLWLTIEGRQA